MIDKSTLFTAIALKCIDFKTIQKSGYIEQTSNTAATSSAHLVIQKSIIFFTLNGFILSQINTNENSIFLLIVEQLFYTSKKLPMFLYIFKQLSEYLFKYSVKSMKFYVS